MRSFVGLAALVAGLAGCTSLGSVPTAKVANGTLYLANGLPAGSVLITAAGDELTLSVAATGLSQGVHGIHLHTTGVCTAPGFTSAGSHLNPHGKQHGTSNPAGSHLGDLPNLTVDAQGRGAFTAKLAGTRSETEAAMFDADGTAVVIHAKPDDYRTDPTGNSGDRIACAVLKRG